MKNLILICVLSTLLFSISSLNGNDVKKINEVIHAFSSAGDSNDSVELSKYLDSNYRVIMNQLFGSKSVNIMPRDVYIGKIRSKEFGGDTRSITIHNVTINGNSASAKVTFRGKKATFVSLIGLVKHSNGIWKLISDTPFIAK